MRLPTRSLRSWMLTLLPCLALACSGDPEPEQEATPTASPTPSPTPAPTPEPTPVDWVTHTEKLMTFWMNANVDVTYGGYYSGVDRSGTVTDFNKWTRMVSREVYGFVKAFQLSGDPEYLDYARSGVDWLLNVAYDQEHGGFRVAMGYDGLTEVDTGASGNPDDRSLFDLSYALTGLVAYYEVTQDAPVKAIIDGVLEQLEDVAWDHANGGYYVSLSADMEDVTDNGKDFNATVDPATAVLFNLYAATGDAAYKERLEQLGMYMVDHLMGVDDTGWIGERFTREWEYAPQDSDMGDRTICGHNFKVVWSLERLYFLLGTELFRSSAEELLKVALDGCRDKDYGGVYDVLERQSGHLTYGYQKAWWQQEEALFALQLMYHITDKSYYSDVAQETLRFYLDYFWDDVYYEVYFTVYQNGNVKDATKGNEWKSAYHSTELAYFSHLYESLLERKTPVTLHYHFEAAETDRTVRLVPAELPYGTYTVKDPATLDGTTPIALDTPSQLIFPAGKSGTLAVTYLPTSN